MNEVEHGSVDTGAFTTYINRCGKGNDEAVIFLQGSGPGASAWSNWQYALPVLGGKYDCIAPDLIGFGKSEHPDLTVNGMNQWMRIWVDQIMALIEHLDLHKVHIVGNSLGGAIALQILAEGANKIDKVVLMGTAGSPMEITRELDLIWGFFDDPSASRMARAMTWFSYDDQLLGDSLNDIAKLRYDAAMDPNVRQSYEHMFPAPRQQHLDDMVIPVADLKRISNSVLLVHGRDDAIVPLSTSMHLLNHLGGDVQLHVYGRCSHWTQVEYKDSFHRLLNEFFEGHL